MKVAVIGTGYVGLVAGACLAELGHRVFCVDSDAGKIEGLRKGIIPIYEPGLDHLVKSNEKRRRLFFLTSTPEAVKQAEVVFIAVGTPSGEDGSADLQYVLAVAEEIGKSLNGYKVIVNKSTVPVGTADAVRERVKKFSVQPFDVVSNPEFLREGVAVKDFLKPERVVVGADSVRARKVMEKLYAPLKAEKLFCDVRSAELIKYASNCFLAVKISFINEVANLCERTGADVEMVSRGMGSDSRIGPRFLSAGCGYGGSCFPKDVKALIHTAQELGVSLKVIEAAESVNETQKVVPVRKLLAHLGSLNGKTIAVLGLAFKPKTDDLREASSLSIVRELQKRGAQVRAFDPVALKHAQKLFPGVLLADSALDAAQGADAVVLVTEWEEFKKMDFKKLKSVLKGSLVVDGRNAWDPQKVRSAGLVYEGIGRSEGALK